MKDNTNILKLFDFDSCIKKIDDINLSDVQSTFIKNEVRGKILIDSVYFSGSYASIYFKRITDFNKDSLKQICNIHKTIWNQRKVPFLYVSTPTELRVYNCFKEPINPDIDTELEKLSEVEIKRYSVSDTKEHLQNLVNIFGKASIDSGEIWKNAELTKHFNSTKRVDDKLVKNLKETKLQLEKHNIPADIIHNLLTRSLFILYLEDIKAIDNGYYRQFRKGATSYFHVLTDANATYKLYKTLEEKFNGDLFSVSETELETVSEKELSIISSCFWGHEISGQQTLWKIFDFSVIPIELMSEIYEIFLNKTDKEKSKSGEYYTPHSLVDLILNESLPWASKENTKYDLAILDLACGSGIFLVESYRRLVNRWIYSNNQQPEFDDLKRILLNSIYGFEINPSSIKVAAFSLYLALISHLDPKTIWQQKATKFPNLIFDPNREDQTRQGKNLYLQSSLSNTIEHQSKFDLIVGNPPFKSAKTGSIDSEASEYCRKYGFAQEMVLPFLHRANEFCNENGKVSIVSTSKILFNKSGGYVKFREFLFQDNYVEVVFNFSLLNQPSKGLGKRMYADAIGPSCVLFYKKTIPDNPNYYINYISPKPSKRDQFTNELTLDELDFVYLPRYECQKPDTIIWKTAMWGTEGDFKLIQRFKKHKSISKYITKKNGWHIGGGFKFMTLTKDSEYYNNEINKLPFLEAENLQRFFTPKKDQNINNTLTNSNVEFYLKHYNVSNTEDLPPINLFRHEGNIPTYYEPHLLIKEGLQDKRLCSSYLNYNCCFKHTVRGITFEKEQLSENDFKEKVKILKVLTAFFNSKFSAYFSFLTSISWGIDIRRITEKDFFSLPALSFEIDKELINEFAKKIDEIINELSKDFPNETFVKRTENEIDEMVYKSLSISERERFLIEDVLNYSIETYHEGQFSPAYKPINKNNDELKEYLQILCEDINEHFEFSGTTVWSSIQEMPATNPMRLVAIYFTNEHKAGHIETFTNSSEINKLISKIDKYSYEKHSASVYFRKVVKYYEDDILYIIKPNQKRFWSRSQAMQDSQAILLEMANMGGV